MMRNQCRQAAWDLTAGTCFYCRRQLLDDTGNRSSINKFQVMNCMMEVDHKIPTTQGGTDASENLVPCCNPCNTHKGGRTADEYRRHLLRGGIVARFFGDTFIPRDWLLVQSFPKSQATGFAQARRRFKVTVP